MWRPALRAADLDAERQVILDEILMHADEPADEAAEQSSATLFPGHPLGREVLGTQSSVEAMTAARIRAFFDEHYLPGNMVVAVAGDLDHDRVVAGLADRAGEHRGGSGPERTGPTTTVTPLAVTRRSTEQAHVGAGRPLGRPQPPEPLRTGRAQPRPGRGPVEPPLPGDPRAPGPGLLGVVGAGRLRRRRIPQRGPRYRPRARGRGPRHRHRRAGGAGRRRDHRARSWPSPRATSGPRRSWPARTPVPG